jgi:hypothetical protein
MGEPGDCWLLLYSHLVPPLTFIFLVRLFGIQIVDILQIAIYGSVILLMICAKPVQIFVLLTDSEIRHRHAVELSEE